MHMIGKNRRVLLLVALASAAGAQDTGPFKLTLRDAVGLALKQNPQVILGNLGVAVSEQERLVARSALLPQLAGNVSETDNRVNLQASLGLPIPGFPQHVGPFQVFQAGARFNAPVFDLTLWRRYREARFGIEANRAQETTAARRKPWCWWFPNTSAASARRRMWKPRKSRVDLAQALYDQAADLQKNGVGTGIDTLRANVQLQNEKQRLIVAQTQLQTSLFGLARLLSVDPHRKIELADQVSFFETPAGLRGCHPGARLRHAVRSCGRSLAQQQRAELELRAADEERLPKISVIGLLGGAGSHARQRDSGVPIPGQPGRAAIHRRPHRKPSAPKPIWPYAQLKQQEQDLRDRIALEVKTAMAQLESARNEVDRRQPGRRPGPPGSGAGARPLPGRRGQ